MRKRHRAGPGSPQQIVELLAASLAHVPAGRSLVPPPAPAPALDQSDSSEQLQRARRAERPNRPRTFGGQIKGAVTVVRVFGDRGLIGGGPEAGGRAEAGGRRPRCAELWSRFRRRMDAIRVENAAMGNSFSNISAFQSLHIVMLGLDSAGKTTVLYRLKFNEFVNTVPTIGFNTEKIKLSNGTAKGISCHFWDVGGQEKLRPLWKSYSRCTDGIIYVVDSVDVDRLEEAKTELHKVTKFAENQGTPLLVIANKQDLPKSLPVADIEKQLALHELTPATTYHIQPACAIIGEGLHEGMDKLYEMIVKRRRSLKQKKKR
ncbi:hypothetical protein Q5P01_014070 [Channa striata]|uniref:ADP-ribosylation factor-like protein 4C n=1 Tax=Channa striata TaxID=64152 RepID=A0AA88SP59_CHASR|nr:hypothetical protein Q5P01_014070 [Channa striata]